MMSLHGNWSMYMFMKQDIQIEEKIGGRLFHIHLWLSVAAIFLEKAG